MAEATEKKRSNPLVVTVLVIAVVGVLGFVVRQAMVATAPPTPAASGAPSVENPAPPAEAQRPKPVISPDVARGVNPFRPVPGSGTSAGRTAAQASLPPVPPAPNASIGTTPAPSLIAQDRERRAAALRLSQAEGSLPPLAGTSGAGVQPMPVAVAEPVLTGTMLGSRPMAVFAGGDKSTVMIPQGGAFMGWRVLRVGHGEATVWNGAVTRVLRVGAPSSEPAPPSQRSAGALDASPTAYARANYIEVRGPARTAPTRRELVYGRLEKRDELELGTPAPPADPPIQPQEEGGPLPESPGAGELEEPGS